MKKLLLFLLAATAAFAANTTIKDIATTSVLPATNDFTVTDGATYGTRKVAAKSLTFLTTTRTTLAALNITGAADSTGILVLGASAAGDGGGASYFWSAASTATPNGDTVIQPASLPATGRWLKATGNIGVPGVSTLGGVFSNVGLAHKFVSAINTDGTVTLTQPAASDITGLGTMAAQNSTAVSITGGSIEGLTSLGNVTPIVNAGITNLNVGSGLHILTGAGLVLDAGSGFSRNANSGVNSYISFNQTSVGSWQIGNKATSGDFTIAGFLGDNLNITYLTGAAKFSGELKAGYGIFTSPVGAYNSTTGGIYFGYGAGTSIIRSVADNSANPSPISMQVGNGVEVGVFNTTGLFFSSAAIQRSTKGNMNLTVNVKDYGALGNGAANDAAAINAAIAALVSHGTLYFPPGKYRFTSGLSGFASLSYITVTGQGAELFNDTGATGSNTLVFDSTCDHVEVCNLRITGNASVRANGIHIRMYASNSSIHDNFLQGCSDFAIHVSNSGAAWSTNVVVANNIIVSPLGDGIHFGNILNFSCTGNLITSSGDDSIAAVADDPAHTPQFGTITGNTIKNAGSDGIRIEEANDILIASNIITTSVLAGIEVNRYTSTTAYNARIHIDGNRLYNTQTSVGPRGSIWVNFLNESTVTNNYIYDQANGSGIVMLDFNDLAIIGNTIRGSPSRAIATDDSTTTNVATNWYSLTIHGNDVQYNMANESIYIVPASGITMNNIVVDCNSGNQLPGGNWIFYNRVTTGKVGNNTSRDGLAVAAGGSVAGVTAFNNN